MVPSAAGEPDRYPFMLTCETGERYGPKVRFCGKSNNARVDLWQFGRFFNSGTLFQTCHQQKQSKNDDRDHREQGIGENPFCDGWLSLDVSFLRAVGQFDVLWMLKIRCKFPCAPRTAFQVAVLGLDK